MQKLAALCIRRPVFATMLIVALLVLGLASYRNLGVDLFPKIDFPTVTVTTTLRGAAPEEIETQVTKRLEEAVNTVSSIDEMRSISAEGLSQIFVTFLLEKDPDVAAQEVRDKVAAVVRDLPKDADPPVIEKLSTDAAPVINVVVGSSRDLRETTKLADDRIKKNIESISGVGQVRFVGERNRQIQVWLDGQKLYAYNLNVEQVRNAIAAQNVEIPGGRIDQGRRELDLRTLGRIERPQDFSRLIVATVGGTPVRLSDIAAIEDGVEEPRSLARLDGTPAVVLEVRKQSGTNTLDVIHAVKARVVELSKTLPPDFKISYTRDQSTFIEESFKAVQAHLILGGFFAAIVVMLFMRDWRSTLIAAVAIPTSIISTYTLMEMMGFTLNQITMLALTLVVGIVIDDAIVVLENIFRFTEEKSLPPMQAAVEATRDIALAVMATTFSLIIIFLPVAMMGGIVGRFMSSFGYTAAFAILVSLLVSFTLTPMLCSRFLKVRHGDKGSRETGLFLALDRPYLAMLRWSLRHRWAISVLAFLVMISSVPLFMSVGKTFLPVDDQNEFQIAVRMPVGSSLEGSADMMNRLEAEVRHLPGIAHILTTVGADLQRRVDRGYMTIELIPMDERPQGQIEIMGMARDRLKKYRDLTVGVQLPSIIQGQINYDLQFYLQGPDLDRLNRDAAEVKRRLAQVPGVVDLDSSYEQGKPEIRVHINRDKAADLNVNVASIATAMRTLVGGDVQVTTYREGEDRYDVQLRLSKEFRDSPDALQRLYVPSATLGNVAVANVTSLEQGGGPTQIERYNRQRQILISANLVNGQSLSVVLPIVNQVISDLQMPADYRSGLYGGSKEFGRAATNFVVAFVLSLIFMYMVLAAQFESFVDPIIILISLPLSVPFALLSLVLAHQNFSIIYNPLGLLILFGIVKKNSILQIDHIKSLQARGVERGQAILQGCQDRLRPILMTTAALVAGMIPLAVGSGAGAGSRRTVAIVVIGGQTLCLLLTLLVTPVAYSLAEDFAHAAVWRKLVKLWRRPWRAAGVTGAILALALLAAPLAAQAPPRVGVGQIQRKLTLEDAIAQALKSNLDVEIERTNTATAQEALRGAHGAFDPTFHWLPTLQSRNTPAGSILVGAGGALAEHEHTENFNLNQKLPFAGSSLGINFENDRLTSSNPFVSLNPTLTSRLVVQFTQPLLRNREIDSNRALLKIRRKQVDISETQFELRAIDVVSRVEQAYWDLVSARQNTQVLGDTVEWAREQLARNQRMIAAGSLAPVELAASEAELQRRMDDWYAAIGTITEAENALKALLSGDRNDPFWSDEIIPVDDHTVAAPDVDDLGEAVAHAVQARPELKVIAAQQQVNQIEKRQNADQTRPQVNLVAGYISAGLAGSVRSGANPITASSQPLYDRVNQLSAQAGFAPLPNVSLGGLPDNLLGGYGATLANLFAGRYQSFQAGLSVDLTLRNQAAEANLAQSVIAERRLKLERAQAEQVIEVQVRNALQAMRTARQRISATEAAVRAAREKLESETRSFQTGESTNFLVLTRQNEYADARHRLLVANLDFNKAVARLEQAMGNTLPAHHLSLK